MFKRVFLMSASIASLFSILAILSGPAAATGQSTILPDDGTYEIVTVNSFEACTALCSADKQRCRGAIAEQPDTRYDVMQCKLNDGTGTSPAFPPTPPTPLNENIAVADLNDYRVSKGLKRLTLNNKLSIASLVHAQDLAANDTISHTGSDGSGHGDRVQRQGYYFSIAGENVATGQTSWERAFKAWQDSPGHNENLLRDDVTEFGIALVYEPTTSHKTYWAMLVAAPLDPELIPYIVKKTAN